MSDSAWRSTVVVLGILNVVLFWNLWRLRRRVPKGGDR